ncbi:MAG: NIPSNAP family protein [Verrucomicrobia bacterium]|nr:NIPSNAP family protein [Verrucomicrobiota bacterium]
MLPSLRPLLLALLAIGTSAATPTPARAADAPVFELRTYTAEPGKLDALLARFRDHTCKLFEKHGMVNVGYWVPLDAKDGAGEKLIYLLQHKSREAAQASWKAFGADPGWQAARKASEAAGKILARSPEAVFLSATDYSPALSAGKAARGAPPRVFELRTYTAAEGKLAALDARFRDYTLALFTKHGMTNIIYLHPLDADKGAGRTLIYLLAHADREAAKASWAAFRANPAWATARADSEKGGKLTDKTGAVFLAPTDFSTLK